MPNLILDKTDLKILAELQLNGRLTNVELAERVALSPSPCLRRLKQLEESGVIRQYVALLDPAKIGLGLQAFVRVTLEKRGQGQMIASFLEAVQTWPEVINCYAMTGEMDYLLQVYFEDLEHFSRFVMDALLQHPGIEDVKSSFVLKELKRTTAMPLAQMQLS
ncbi:Lrp/AsnC family transcriptional regulator [Crenobacter sp. SG2303]|uniref:Lrp/AsnC family transcriptional regulator n=1 Tax=Crenobacter oryzisoli TaxID=3056844 RepID=A0ABT7XHM2_9NEIS|nr:MULTISPECIES: Lrp/AsnC family transcriptional regulator [unclassified Crenobacter]MDN0073285.1 Lrp/AsnC family transcriptional regulator [Crenobacter sp. SG2303]MDN0084366.1 Lrp/AsnC family transcriptional regulator [Crenobacter sp. SG2305]